jgi:hypothetical protein
MRPARSLAALQGRFVPLSRDLRERRIVHPHRIVGDASEFPRPRDRLLAQDRALFRLLAFVILEKACIRHPSLRDSLSSPVHIGQEPKLSCAARAVCAV